MLLCVCECEFQPVPADATFTGLPITNWIKNMFFLLTEQLDSQHFLRKQKLLFFSRCTILFLYKLLTLLALYGAESSWRCIMSRRETRKTPPAGLSRSTKRLSVASSVLCWFNHKETVAALCKVLWIFLPNKVHTLVPCNPTGNTTQACVRKRIGRI